MKMTNKQKAGVATALAVGVIATQGYFLLDQHKENINLEEQLTKQVALTKDITKENEKAYNTIKELESSNAEKDEKIKELKDSKTKLESEKAKLSAEVKKLSSGVYPTSVSRGTSSRNTGTTSGTPITMTLTFYGDGADENGGYAGMNAYSGKLTAGTVASNVYPRGTKFRLPNGQVLTVNDKGGSDFDSYNRLDVFVPRLSGESDYAYKKRISDYGRKTLTVYKY